MKLHLIFLLLIIPFFIFASNLDILNDEPSEAYSKPQKPKTALELEDEKFVSIRRRNSEDAILPEFTLELAEKHLNQEEYVLAQYYVKVYLRDYRSDGQLERAWLLGLLSLFEKLKLTESQDTLLQEILRVGSNFENTFPKSPYLKHIKKIVDESIRIEYKRNNDIANYYEKIGKPQSAAFYRAKNTPYEEKMSQLPQPSKKKQSNLELLREDTFE
jgi:outer membrane protein assembly factor BamD